MGEWIGARVRPLDWDDRSVGRVAYTADHVVAETLAGRAPLHGAILRSPHPYAEIRRIDVSRAERMPGVRAVITAADFAPGITYLHRGAPLSDRPPLAAGVVRHVGQEVAAVAADTPELARAGLRAIRVRYRVRRAPLTIGASRRAGAVRLHERTTAEPNVAQHLRIEWGDAAAGRAAASVRVAGRFVHPSVSHACMEPNTTLAAWDPDREIVELWTSTQAPWFIAKEVSHLLGLRHDQVVCREVAVGGGFGSKSKASEHEVLAAALARKASRPVLVELTRAEEFGANKPRHRFETTLTTAADADGVLRALDADVAVDNGAYNHMGTSVMRVGVITLGSMYRPDGVRFDARLVDTATQPGGQFRGYGTPQVSLAMESQVDEIAAELGVDPLELRLRNLAPEDATTLCGYEVGTTRLGDCLVAVREGLDWAAPRPPERDGIAHGKGVAGGSHGSGAYAYEHADRSDAALDLYADGHVRVRHGGADAGTGQNTILAQIAAQELGLPLDRVSVTSMDGEHTPFELGAWSSRGTHMTGSSVGQAARELAGRLRDLAAAKLGTEAVTLTGGRAVSEEGAVDLGDLVALADDARPDPVPGPREGEDVLSHETSYRVVGTEPLNPAKSTANLSPTYAYAAHGARVTVDRLTGEVTVVDYVAAHDVGRPVNPTLVEGQIVGGAAMGLGAALGEELIREGGRVVNAGYLHYAMPRNADLPSIRPVVVDNPDEARGPYGAKAVGEMSIIPPGAAVANAVADAIGVRIRELPITPDKVLTALHAPRSFGILRRPSRWWVAAIRAAYPLGLHHVLHHWGTRLGPAYRARRRAVVPAAPLVHAPETLDEALVLLRDKGSAVLGGATEAPIERRAEVRPAPVLVSVAAVTSLRGITTGETGTRIGAATTLAELAAHPDLPAALAQAVETIASPQIREAATVAGNLVQAKRCWFFRNGFDCYKRNGVLSPCYAVQGDHRFQHAVVDGHRCQAVTPSDLGTVLLALDAEVETDRRRIPMAEFYSGPGETVLGQGEPVVAVHLPPGERTTSFTKLALYTGDFAAASAALAVEKGPDGAWTDVRIVLGAMAPTPLRMRAAEDALRGRAPEPAEVAAAVDAELARRAHPLPGNAWKVDAAAGLAHRAAHAI
ncbi:molybdopterin cofactor-binding domain-containing protein [Pseudonocardia sp. WMMC193]|uniref:molybdopterin cofactor-binding domain-containing protein n=1 Tax=Pseudonocardia sp. WMMC193 TaxID=2911965 RepID=UPI001F2B6DA1|nr:molybdopterin cofactor-binding domain-containing protein [Pseudonocardia sp. WMMC193]MCF7548027.1 molybdopterin-dependent oxidoreductase [Pseudonocardia sp. WMMC193]